MFEIDDIESGDSCDISTYYFYNFESQKFELDIGLKNKLLNEQRQKVTTKKNLFYIGKKKEKIKNLEKKVKEETEKKIKYLHEIAELKEKLKR